jgi:hypothetical protein
VYEQRNVAYHVHRETAKFSGKVPEILEVIKRDLGNPIEENYEDIEAVFDRTLGTYIKESPGFESKAINSIQVNNPNGTKGPKILSRAEWIQDLERVKEGVKGANLVKKVQMGMIFEFIIKHEELTECFIAGFVHDCTHAYANGHLSCFAGIIERTISTLINCIKGMDEGVFGELNEIIENNIESWSELDKAKQAAYIMKWNEFLLRWSQANSENEVIKGMTAAERSNAAMSDFKREERVPRYVEEHIQAELFPLLTDGIWSDYGFNASTSVGGKRRKTRRNRKTRKHRKTTRHRKTRIHRKKTTRRR